MLTELRMKLETDRPDFGYYQASNMHGVLMEQLAPAYAAQLHEQTLRPYSQYILMGEPREWVIHTCTAEAYEKMILPLLSDSFMGFCVRKKEIDVKILEKKLRTVRRQELLEEFYAEEYSRCLHLEFVSPTSFKSNGRYLIMPDVRYIYQSLMNKYSAWSPDMDMYDTQTLEQLTNSSNIVQYRLRSVFFPLEGVKIPSFKGEIKIKINGTATMAKYARLLARFGEYSGVGIKTALGMGGLKIKTWRCDND